MKPITPIAPPKLELRPDVKTGFKELFQNIKERINQDSNSFDKLSHVLSGKALSSQDLLKIQIQVHQIGTRVEVVGKIAEGANTIIKRLQG